MHPISSSSRREFLAWSGLGLAAMMRPRQERAKDDDDLLDAGLARIQAQLPTANPHRSNHVAMVCEALCVLGSAHRIDGWLDDSLDESGPDKVAVQRIDADRWRDSLSRAQHFASWRAFFASELAHDDWRAVVRRWVPRFAPGLASAAAHGVIRTAHAARALSVRDNEIRRRELATGLAYWASTYESLPWDESLAPQESVTAALAKIQPRRPANGPPSGNLISAFRTLHDAPSFRAVAGLVDTRDPSRTLGEITSACARLYLANNDQRIAFAHSVTAPSALRLLVPHLDDEAVETSTRYAWQVAAGLYVLYANPMRAIPERPADPTNAIVERAVANGATHGIKLTEACLREHAITQDATLIRAAHDASIALQG